MIVSAVASRYASALVDAVVASPTPPEDVLGKLRGFQELMAGSAELRNALASPAVTASRKRAVVARLGDRLDLSGMARNFLFVLIDRGRLSVLPQILDAFEQHLDEHLGFARADVTTARELDQAQRDSVVVRLERVAGKKIRARFHTDPALIGGVTARIGSTVYDGSVRGQLAAVERALERRLTAE